MKKLIIFTFLIFLSNLLLANTDIEYIKSYKDNLNYKGDCIHTNNAINFKLLNRYNGLCFLVYMNNEQIHYVLPEAKIYETSNKSLKAFLLFNHNTKTQYIVVRGSFNIANWVSNFTANKILCEKLDMTFHNGFRTAAFKLYNLVKDDLKKDYKTVVTGHSLGGALAVILGMFLDDDFFNIKEVVTFGQPRVTTLEGKERINKSIPVVRVLNDTDVVSLVPPTKVMEFYHVGLGLILLRDNTLTIDKGEADGINYDKTAEEEIILKNSDLNDPRIDEKIYFIYKLRKELNKVSTQMHYPQFYSKSLESKFNGYKFLEYKTRYTNQIPFVSSTIVKRYSKQMDGQINLRMFDKYFFKQLLK